MGRFTSSFAFFAVLCGLSVACVAMGWVMVWQLTPEFKRRQRLRWLRDWSIKGLLVPFALWAVMNVGVSWNLQAFMPQVQVAQNSGGNWFPGYLRVIVVGLFVITSYWGATTLGWGLVQAGASVEEEARRSFKALCWTCFLGMVLPAGLVVLLGGLPSLGLAVVGILAPMAGYAPAVIHIKKLPPMYARAVARLKFGKYSEAEQEIIRELEKCEDDFEGWMMLADLYANQFNDLPGAEQTILEICDQPRTTKSQLSVALHRLADWHLKLAVDPDAARRCLQMICDRLHGTHLAHMAQLRINQLPTTAVELLETQSARPIPLPALGDRLDREVDPAEPEETRHEAAALANQCVEQLKRDPNNVPAREKLARILTERLHEADRGIEQLNLLLDLPGQDQARRADWLSQAAAWQIKYRHDTEAGRRLLEQLVQEFPESPQAFAARHRLESMG